MPETNNIRKKIVALFLLFSIITLIAFAGFNYLSQNIDTLLYETREHGNAIFPYEPDFEEDIFKDKEYMELDRLICYKNELTGVLLSLDDSNYTKYGDTAKFMYEYITAIINGDTEFYNSSYTEEYIAAEGMQYPFTMQKLYDITFGVMYENQLTERGETAFLWLDYKIFKNNVTLRTDIGSNVCRRQYIFLVKDENANYKIDSVAFVQAEPIKELKITSIVWLIVIAIAFVAVSALAVILVLRKYSTPKKKFEPKTPPKIQENDI